MWVYIDSKGQAMNPKYIVLRAGYTHDIAGARALIHWDECESARIGRWNYLLAVYFATDYRNCLVQDEKPILFIHKGANFGLTTKLMTLPLSQIRLVRASSHWTWKIDVWEDSN
jgi:hypothetical protein